MLLDLKDGAYYCLCAHYLRITQCIDHAIHSPSREYSTFVSLLVVSKVGYAAFCKRNTIKESRTASLFETNVKTSVDEFLRISQNANVELTRERMGKNVTQPKGDSIQVENRSNNLKKHVVIPTFYAIK